MDTKVTSEAFHLKGLNGLRAIAAISVVITHIVQGLEYFDLPRMYGLEMAGYGVTLFFALSGFLITYLLLLEKEKYGNINIRQFYLRRILRIWPLYYLYLILAVIALFVYDPQFLNGNIFFYILLLANVPLILGAQLPVLHHFWSLGVEEQFYLFWPWVVKHTKKLKRWLIVFISALLIIKLGAWYYFSRTGNAIPLNTVHFTRFHCMALGALAALLHYEKNRLFLKFSFHIVTQVIVWICVGICAVNKFFVAHLINDELIALISIMLILNVSLNPRTLIRMDNSYLNYIGRISFGIYVYHPLVIYMSAKWLGGYISQVDKDYRYILIYFLVMFSTIAIAHLSYKFFEKPFLQLKEKYARVKSSR
jgi:peptidoglycan/LPS O-acetylase OafA/YrhL